MPGTRPAPGLTDLNRAFWTGGAYGQLLIARCADCLRWQHPPLLLCPNCHSRDIVATPVSGKGTVWSWTTNRYAWFPTLPPPYVVAEVELAEQPGLRLLTALVDCDEPRIGTPVSVRFEPAGDAWAPVFAPVAGAA